MNQSKKSCQWVFLWTMLILPFLSLGQQAENAGYKNPAGIRPLRVGDQVPDITIRNIINYPHSDIRFSQIVPELVLIDFWGTTCGSCISFLPVLDELQQQNAGRMQVFTVTNFDTKDKVTATLERLKKKSNLQLPVVLNDVQLKALFPHELVSHIVWIRKGVVEAITRTDYVTEDNINMLLSGKKISWPQKIDLIGFDYGKPLLSFSQPIAYQPERLYFSSFTGAMPGVDSRIGFSLDTIEQTITCNFFNHSLLQFAAGAVDGSGAGYPDPKGVRLEVKDPSRFVFHESDSSFFTDWAAKNMYCYSVTLPLQSSELDHYKQLLYGNTADGMAAAQQYFFRQPATKEYFRKDLSEWLSKLGVTVEKANRPQTTLLLVKRPNAQFSQGTRNAGNTFEMQETATGKRLTAAKPSDLVWFFNNEVPDLPWVYDETGITGDLYTDMDLHLHRFNDIPLLRIELHRYGLDLIETRRPREVYVIKETSPVDKEMITQRSDTNTDKGR